MYSVIYYVVLLTLLFFFVSGTTFHLKPISVDVKQPLRGLALVLIITGVILLESDAYQQGYKKASGDMVDYLEKTIKKTKEQ